VVCTTFEYRFMLDKNAYIEIAFVLSSAVPIMLPILKLNTRYTSWV
jgi:hypothetical protein